MLAQAHREEWGRVFGSMVRFTGDWNLAEDCTQDAFARALERWEVDGIPRSPGAWLTVAARNRALDVLRRATNEWSKLRELGDFSPTVAPGADVGFEDLDGWEDERLRLLFTCCHPALAMEARVALTLRTVGRTHHRRDRPRVPGPRGDDVAAHPAGEAQDRATPASRTGCRRPQLLAERTAGVLAVVYLMFNEGYSASRRRRAVRDELAGEAIRLARLLVELMPDDPEARGLLALLLLQHSRRAARLDAAGDLVTLDEQDRTRWDPPPSPRALACSGAPPRHPTPAATCCRRRSPPSTLDAADAAETDWGAVVDLYDRAAAGHPAPIVDLNRAVALGRRDGPDAALAAIDQLALRRSSSGITCWRRPEPTPSSRRAAMPRRRSSTAAARHLAPGDAERRLLDRRIAECAGRVPR